MGLGIGQIESDDANTAGNEAVNLADKGVVGGNFDEVVAIRGIHIRAKVSYGNAGHAQLNEATTADLHVLKSVDVARNGVVHLRLGKAAKRIACLKLASVAGRDFNANSGAAIDYYVVFDRKLRRIGADFKGIDSVSSKLRHKSYFLI